MKSRGAITATAALTLLLVTAGCATHTVKPRPADADSAPKPVLKGRVVDQNSQPIENVDVKLYSGLDTRWRLASTHTDAAGEYIFDPCPESCLILNAVQQRWEYLVCMRVRHPQYVSADGHRWWDIRVPRIDGLVVRKDFTMVPQSED